MNKILLAAGILGMVAIGNSASGQAWSENFNNGLPAGWVLINNDNLTPNSAVSFVNNAWVTRIKTNANGDPIPGDSVMISNSWYTSAGSADDWMITPAFNVTDPGLIIKWEEKAYDASYPDGYQVLVSTTGTAITDFTTTVLTVPAANASAYTIKYANLGAFNGQAIHVAFRNNSNDKYLLAIDNIDVTVPPNDDISLTGMTPVTGAPNAYGKTGGTLPLGGTVFNNGINTITSYKVHYQEGGGPVTTDIISGVNIAPFTYAKFTAPTAFNIPSALADYQVNMWLELTGDNDATNDSSQTTVTGVSFLPNKRTFVEEGTGTWCGWCPRGAVYMDSLYNTYKSAFSLVAVHNGDPMVHAAYDAFLGGKIGGYPSVLVDRREEKDPSELIEVYNNEKDYFGFADITLTDVAAVGFGYSVKATVKPAIDLSGDYRLALVITEDEVHGSESKFAQTNYYSYESNNISLTGAGHDWKSEKDPVPADKMTYNFVARDIVPSVDGAAGSLPSTMTNGNTYDYTFTTTINPGYRRNKMRAVVILIRNSDGMVLNSNTIDVPLGVKDVDAGIDDVTVYPNPASNQATLRLSLSAASKVNVQVTDALGRVVYTVAGSNLAKGNHSINIPTGEFAAGTYNVRLQTEKGSVTQLLSVLK